MARTSYGDLGVDPNLLPEASFPESGYHGGSAVPSHPTPLTPGTAAPPFSLPTPAARPAPPVPSGLGLDPNAGIGLSPAPSAQAPTPPTPPAPTPLPTPPPVVNPPTSIPTVTPPVSQPGIATPTQTPQQVYDTIDQQLFRPINDMDTDNVARFLTDNKIHIDPGWRQELQADPKAFMKKYWAFNGVGQYVYNSLKTGRMADPNAAQNALQETQKQEYNVGLQRLEQSTAYGGRQAEEELLSGLASRGLLDSGIAARELERFRGEKLKNMQDAALSLNQILLSGADTQMRNEMMARLQADLQRRNQEALANLEYKLIQQTQDRLHQNDFVNFLANVGGTIAQGALAAAPAVPVAASAAAPRYDRYGPMNDVMANQTNPLYGPETGLDILQH